MIGFFFFLGIYQELIELNIYVCFKRKNISFSGKVKGEDDGQIFKYTRC